MQLHQLQRVHKNKRSQLVGRGGKRGKTSGRGGKGQTARSGHKVRPEFRDALMRIPKQRGRGTNSFKPFREKPEIVSIEEIEKVFNEGESVTPETIAEKGLVQKLSGRIPEIKILGDGELTKKLFFSGCKVSESARKKIEKA
jgi:large subunit ribosomal protein L15